MVQGRKDKLRNLNAQGLDNQDQKRLLGEAMDIKQTSRKSRDEIKEQLRVTKALKKNAAASDESAHKALTGRRARDSDRRAQAKREATSGGPSTRAPGSAAGFSRFDTPLQYVPAEHQDKTVVLAAVSSRPVELAHAPAEFRLDRDVALAAVSGDGRALKFLGQEMRGDRDIIMAAMGQPKAKAQKKRARLGEDGEAAGAPRQKALKALKFCTAESHDSCGKRLDHCDKCSPHLFCFDETGEHVGKGIRKDRCPACKPGQFCHGGSAPHAGPGTRRYNCPGCSPHLFCSHFKRKDRCGTCTPS